jgi:hypothetical protein
LGGYKRISRSSAWPARSSFSMEKFIFELHIEKSDKKTASNGGKFRL